MLARQAQQQSSSNSESDSDNADYSKYKNATCEEDQTSFIRKKYGVAAPVIRILNYPGGG
ncbi:MAG: hypothetical protein WBP64_15635 [Nitrososphaeraceae archaeon]